MDAQPDVNASHSWAERAFVPASITVSPPTILPNTSEVPSVTCLLTVSWSAPPSGTGPARPEMIERPFDARADTKRERRGLHPRGERDPELMLVNGHGIVAIVEREPDVGRRDRVEATATDLDLEAGLEVLRTGSSDDAMMATSSAAAKSPRARL